MCGKAKDAEYIFWESLDQELSDYYNNYRWKHLSSDKELDVVIPDGIKKIPDNFFSDHAALRSVVLPNSITRIPSETFMGCKNLKKVKLGNKVTQIGRHAFNYCGIESIEFPETLRTISMGAFSECASLKEIMLPDSVQSIGPEVFSDCTSLEKVVLPKRLNRIPALAFANCKKLKEINLDDVELSSILYSAFSHCESLADENGFLVIKGKLFTSDIIYKKKIIKIPPSVKIVGNGAFSMNPDILQQMVMKNIYGNDKYTPNLYSRKIVVPKTVEKIEPGAFADCINLQEVTIHCKTDEEIIYAFARCKKLKKIKLHRPTTISESVYSSYKALEDKGVIIEYFD